ncbi:MAG TPA: hypothetical protein VFW96_10645 [Thermomicrobiales bacterium]|nr:hypothetical protein [Thermomicrobiales bacterium]
MADDPLHARRPAQVNACFRDGLKREVDIVTALREVGLSDDRITLSERPGPEDESPRMDDTGGFLGRLKELFTADHTGEERHPYDLIVIAHLGDDEALAQPVEEVFKRFDAAEISYYAPMTPTMRPLGGASIEEAETEAAREAGFTGNAELDPGEDVERGSVERRT